MRALPILLVVGLFLAFEPDATARPSRILAEDVGKCIHACTPSQQSAAALVMLREFFSLFCHLLSLHTLYTLFPALTAAFISFDMDVSALLCSQAKPSLGCGRANRPACICWTHSIQPC